MPSGGRPVYTEDFQTLQNEISVFEKITEQNCRNCVLSGCVYTETPNPDGETYNANLTEGYAIINGKICHVAAWHNAAFHHIQLPLYIELVQSDSVERTQLVNGETTPMTINYEGEVRTAGNTMAGPTIFMNRKKSSSSEENDRFTYFHDLYEGFVRKAEVEDVNKRAYIIDLADYIGVDKVLPTTNAAFVYQSHIVQPRTFTIFNANGENYNGLANGTYFAFCIRQVFSLNTAGLGHDYLLYDWSLRFIGKYNDTNAPEFIRDLYGETIATTTKDGRMSKEQVKSLNGKADKTYVDRELENKMSNNGTYTRQEIDDALAQKLNYKTWQDNMDILWGEIKMWAGDNVPRKYALCDGTAFPIPGENPSAPYYDLWKAIGTTFNVLGANGTQDGYFALPDLRGRFIVGKGRGTGDKEFAFKSTGGASEVTLTEQQIPEHTHKYYADDGDRGMEWAESFGISPVQNARRDNSGATGEDGFMRIWNSAKAGENQPHTNLPPYYTLAYIIRVEK